MALLSLLVFANCSCNLNSVTSLTKPGSGPGQQAIVLFHGLGETDSVMDDKIGRDLRQAFPNAEVVALQRNEQQGIAAQAQKLYQDLQANDLHQKDLVFMGISTGGIVAIETLNQHPALAVRGIIAYHSPLEGAPMVAKKQVVDTLASHISRLPGAVSGVNIKQIFEQYTQGRAVQDLKPNSSFMTIFKANLSKVEVPILAIAGKGGSWASSIANLYKLDLSNYNAKILSILNHAWSEQFVGDPDHDGLLPIDSQLAQHINNSCIERWSQAGVSHYGAIPPHAREKIKKNIKSYFQQ